MKLTNLYSNKYQFPYEFGGMETIEALLEYMNNYRPGIPNLSVEPEDIVSVDFKSNPHIAQVMLTPIIYFKDCVAYGTPPLDVLSVIQQVAGKEVAATTHQWAQSNGINIAEISLDGIKPKPVSLNL